MFDEKKYFLLDKNTIIIVIKKENKIENNDLKIINGVNPKYIAITAPKLAELEIPRIYGSTIGLNNNNCKINPLNDKIDAINNSCR